MKRYVTALSFGLGLCLSPGASAQQAVIDSAAISQLTKQLAEAQKVLSELKSQSVFLTNMVDGIGQGGLGVLSNQIGLSSSGLDDLLDEARGLCFSIESLMKLNGPDAPGIALPSFRNGCGGFQWAGEMFFTSPFPNDLTRSAILLEERRNAFYDVTLQSSITTGLSHKERIKDTAQDIASLHGTVSSVQSAEGSEASLRHAITTNSLVQLRVLEELASVRELLAEMLVLSASNGLSNTTARVRSAEDGGPEGAFAPSQFNPESDEGDSGKPSDDFGNPGGNPGGSQAGQFVPPWQH